MKEKKNSESKNTNIAAKKETPTLPDVFFIEMNPEIYNNLTVFMRRVAEISKISENDAYQAVINRIAKPVRIEDVVKYAESENKKSE